MASYQDLETRTERLERMLEFTMKQFQIARWEGIIEKKLVSKTLYDLYLEQESGVVGEGKVIATGYEGQDGH